jgi:hypothetical protein
VGSQPTGDHTAGAAKDAKPNTGGSAKIAEPSTGGSATTAKPNTAGAAKIAEPSTAESPKPETHIAEQRISDDHRATPEAPAKSPTPAAVEKPAKPPSRLSNYQAEAAKLLAGAMTGRRKRRAVPDVPVADPVIDPVAEDQAGQGSRPAKKGQFKKD